MANANRNMQAFYGARLSAFAANPDEHQGASHYPPEVLACISALEIESVYRAVPLRADMRVLDVGAGGGRWTLAAAPLVEHVLALEPSDLFDLLQSRLAVLPNVSCRHESFDQFSPDHTFDLAIVYGVLMHQATDRDIVSFLARAAQAIRPGGHLVLGESMASPRRCWIDWAEVSEEHFVAAAADATYWEVQRSPMEYRRFAQAAGFRLVDSFESHAPLFGRTRLWPLIRALPWPILSMYNRLARAPYGFAKHHLGMRRMHFQIWRRC